MLVGLTDLKASLWIHMKELPAIGGELHKMQVGEWLLEDPDAKYCYVADGANSQQKEILTWLLSCRNKQTGKLEMMAIDIQAIADKTSAGQKQKYVEAMSAIAEAAEEAEMLDGEEGASKQTISGLVPKGYPNDRAANGHKGARMVRGGDGDRAEDDVAATRH